MEFLLPKNSLLSVHVELLKFLTIANTRYQFTELLSLLEKVCSYRPSDVNGANYVLNFASKFSDRVGSRINPTNAPFYFAYLESLRNPTFDDVAMEDQTDDIDDDPQPSDAQTSNDESSPKNSLSDDNNEMKDE